MKIILKKIAKTFGLIPSIDYVRSRWKAYGNQQRNRIFLQSNPTFVPPPLELSFDAYGHVDWQFYHSTGLADATFLSKLILKYAPATPLCILDWGCGPARILSHLTSLMPSRHLDIYGTDYNPNTIQWCCKHVKGVSFSLNSMCPPMNFEANKFDVIYGISVLTHLSEQSHFDWIRELERLLKPGGILILTTHGDRFRHVLEDHEKAIYDSGKLVVRDQVNEGRRGFATFHPPKFLQQKLFHSFNTLAHIEEPQGASIQQDFWVLQKK